MSHGLFRVGEFFKMVSGHWFLKKKCVCVFKCLCICICDVYFSMHGGLLVQCVVTCRKATPVLPRIPSVPGRWLFVVFVSSRIQCVYVCVCVFVLCFYVSFPVLLTPNIPVFLSFCSFPHIFIISILLHFVVHFSYQVFFDQPPASFTLPHPYLSCLWPIPSFFVSIVFRSTAVLISVALFLLYFWAPLFYYLWPISIVFLTPPFYYLLPPDICQPCPSCQPEFAPPVLSFVQCLLHTSVFHLWQLVNDFNWHLRNCFSFGQRNFHTFSFLLVTTGDTSEWFQLEFAPSVLSF